LASPSKKLCSVSVGSTLTGKVSVDDIDDADSARGKNLWPACHSPVGEDLSPKPSANISASPSHPVHTNSPPNSLSEDWRNVGARKIHGRSVIPVVRGLWCVVFGKALLTCILSLF
jgi:hypothetical protein